jgi:hypothetical protein
MDVVLGLLGIVAWIGIVVALAAAVTFAVVRLSPGEKPAAPSGPSKA